MAFSEETYAVLNKKLASVTSGIATYEIVGNQLIMTTTGGQTLTYTFTQPKDGVGIDDISISGSGNTRTLTFTMTDGTTKTVDIPVVKGDKGDKGDGISTMQVVDNHLIVTLTDGTEIDCGLIDVTTSMANLEDVDVSTVENGQILIYDSTTNTWKNGNPSATSTSLDDLSNVNIDTITLQDGQIIKYDAVNQVWVNADSVNIESLNDINDVNIVNIQDGQVIAYDSTNQKWVNTDVIDKLSDMTDVELTDLSALNMLRYDSVNNKWVNFGADTTVTDGSTNVVTSGAVYTELQDKADKATTLSGYGITDSYTKTEEDTLLNSKADKSTTLEGYGITDAYTKSETDTLLDGKVDKNGTDSLMTQAEHTKLEGIESGAEVNVQANWNQTDTEADNYIQNKPTLGTASEKNYTNYVSPTSSDLVISSSVYSAIDSAISSVYEPYGNLTCAELTQDLLIQENVGHVYNITDSGTTTNLFIGGAGQTINPSDGVVIVRNGETFAYNLIGQMINLTAYQKKELDTPLEIGGVTQTNLESALDALNTEKANKATTLNGYGIADAYTKSETDTEITNAINDLDVTDEYVSNKFISSVSEADGKITVTRQQLSTTPTLDVYTPISSDGVRKALNSEITPINDKIGTTDISDIGDGTITNAIDTIDSNLTNLDTDLNEVNASLVQANIGSFPEFAISTNSADSYYSGERGGIRNSSEKMLIMGVGVYTSSDKTTMRRGWQLYATSSDAFAQSEYTSHGSVGYITARTTPKGNTVYTACMTSSWTNTNGTLYSYPVTVTIDGATATLNNITNDKYTSDTYLYDDMFNTIIDEVLFGDKDYPSGIYKVKSNKEIVESIEDVYYANGLFGAKNLLVKGNERSETASDITFTTNSDGSVLVNGTNTSSDNVSTSSIYTTIDETLIGKRVTLSSGLTATSPRVNLYFLDSSNTQLGSMSTSGGDYTSVIPNNTAKVRMVILVSANVTVDNVTVYPMLRLASDTDSTYHPYAKTNKELTDDTNTLEKEKMDWVSNGILGAKNLISYPYYSGDSYTVNGVTFTVNDDLSVTANGTATSTAIFLCRFRETHNLKAGIYTINGCPENGSRTTYYQWLGIWDGSTNIYGVYETGSGANVVMTEEYEDYYLVIGCYVYAGQTVSDLTFYPMLRLASDTDSTYQPYAKTNKELTDSEIDAYAYNGIMGAKNLIPYPYHRQNGYTSNGATFTYDDEGVITVNKVTGSSTAYFALFSNILYPDEEKFLKPNTSYILSMELENATDTSCFLQTQNGTDISAIRNKATGKYETSFTTTETIDSLTLGLYYGAEVTEDNAKVKLMIRLASDTDNTYVPYAETNYQLTQNKVDWETNGILGAKNLIPYPFNDTTKTTNGITYTDNGDGTVTCNGTATAGSSFYFATLLPVDSDVSYTVTDDVNGTNTTYFTVVRQLNSNGEEISGDIRKNVYGKVTFTTDATCEYLDIRTYTQPNVTMNNVVFKPMLRLASDSDDTYQPYAKTNKELTNDISELSASLNDKENKLTQGTYTGYLSNIAPSGLKVNSVVWCDKSNVPDAPSAYGICLSLESASSIYVQLFFGVDGKSYYRIFVNLEWGQWVALN